MAAARPLAAGADEDGVWVMEPESCLPAVLREERVTGRTIGMTGETRRMTREQVGESAHDESKLLFLHQ